MISYIEGIFGVGGGGGAFGVCGRGGGGGGGGMFVGRGVLLFFSGHKHKHNDISIIIPNVRKNKKKEITILVCLL